MTLLDVNARPPMSLAAETAQYLLAPDHGGEICAEGDPGDALLPYQRARLCPISYAAFRIRGRRAYPPEAMLVVMRALDAVPIARQAIPKSDTTRVGFFLDIAEAAYQQIYREWGDTL